MRIYAVGDVHGRSALLADMLAAIVQDADKARSDAVVEVFLGDYIDRGINSREVVDLLIAPPPEGHERICLLGNHEAAMLRFLAEPASLRNWASFGGYATLVSYGIAIPMSMSPQIACDLRERLQQNLPAAHVEFLGNLQLTCRLGDYLFVHAGILPGLALEQQKPEHLLWIREPFLSHTGFFDSYVVHGHSPVSAPEIRANRANIDISDAPTDSLCCLVIEGSVRRLLTVTGAKD